MVSGILLVHTKVGIERYGAQETRFIYVSKWLLDCLASGRGKCDSMLFNVFIV